METEATWITTINAVAEATEVDWKTAKKWVKRDDFPRKRRSGWKRLEVMAYAVTALEQAVEAQTGENCDLKAEKLRLECKQLREKIRYEKQRADQAELETRKKQGKTVDIDEVIEGYSELCTVITQAHNNAQQYIDSEKRDAELSEWFAGVIDNARRLMQEKIDAL